jgi:hypothetical protein
MSERSPGTQPAVNSGMSTQYPVHYDVARPLRFTALQLALRVLVFLAVGAAGTSFGALFAVTYVALPVIVAGRLAMRDDPAAFLLRDGPRLTTALRWIAAVTGWAGLVIDEVPLRVPDAMRLSIEGAPSPTAGSAIVRLVSGLPSALVLSILGAIGVFVWLWAALSVLLTQQVGPRAFAYLVGLQRWSVRLLAYQASLVDAYPPFSFTELLGLDDRARRQTEDDAVKVTT